MNTPQNYYISGLTSKENKEVKKHNLEVNSHKGSQLISSKVVVYCFNSAVILETPLSSKCPYFFKINRYITILLLDMHRNTSGLSRLSNAVLIFAYLISGLQPDSSTQVCYETQLTGQQ